MAMLQIHLSDDLEVERLATEAGFEDAGAYVEALLRADRRRRAEERMAEEIRKGLESGPTRRITEDDVRRTVEEYDRRMAANRGSGRVE